MADPAAAAAAIPVSAPAAASPAAAASPSGSPVRLDFQDASPMATETTALTSAAPAPAPGGLAAVWGQLRHRAATTLSDQKPWGELVDRNAFSKPATLAEASSRVQKNLAYFRTNYLVAFLSMIALTFLTHPSALLWTGCLTAGWIYLFLVRSSPLVVAGREYSDREKLIGMSLLSFVVVFFLTSIGATVLYGASVAAAVVALHGAFREPDDLFLDDPNSAGGLFNVNLFQGVQTLPQSSQV